MVNRFRFWTKFQRSVSQRDKTASVRTHRVSLVASLSRCARVRHPPALVVHRSCDHRHACKQLEQQTRELMTSWERRLLCQTRTTPQTTWCKPGVHVGLLWDRVNAVRRALLSSTSSFCRAQEFYLFETLLVFRREIL